MEVGSAESQESLNLEGSSSTSNEPETPQNIDTIHALQILKHIRSLGCTKEEISAATYRTYLDLIEVRKYESVAYHFNDKLDHLYLEVRRRLEDDLEIVVPVTTAKTMSFKEIEALQDTFDTNPITLAICDTSSTIQYYKMERS